MCRFSNCFSFCPCKDNSDRLKKMQLRLVFFVSLVLAAYLKYRWYHLSRISFVWHFFFIVKHTYTHTNTHTHTHKYRVSKLFPPLCVLLDLALFWTFGLILRVSTLFFPRQSAPSIRSHFLLGIVVSCLNIFQGFSKVKGKNTLTKF